MSTAFRIDWHPMLRIILVICIGLSWKCFAQSDDTDPFFSGAGPYTLRAQTVEMQMTERGRTAVLTGGVVIEHGSAILTGDHGWSYEDTDDAVLEGDVRLRDGTLEISAQRLTYNRSIRQAILEGEVIAVDGVDTVVAQRLEYLRDKRMATVGGSVRMVVPEEELDVRGEKGWYDFSDRRGEMTGSAELLVHGERGEMLVRADTMELDQIRNETGARGTVVLTQDKVEVTCGQLNYWMDQERAILWDDPQVQESQDWIRGDTVELFFRNREVVKAVIFPHAHGVYHDTLGRSSRMAGDRMEVEFVDNQVDNLVVEGDVSGEHWWSRQREEP